MSFNELYLLSQAMSTYPSQWSASLKRSLLMDIAILGGESKDAESKDAEIQARLHRVNEFLLTPLARILLSEHETLKSSREAALAKEQQLSAALSALQNEKEAVMKQLEDEKEQTLQQNMFIESLLNEMAKMAKVSEDRKKEIRKLQHTLFVKDLQIQKLTSDRNASDGKTWSEPGNIRPESFEDSMNECFEWVSATASTTTTTTTTTTANLVGGDGDDSSSLAPVFSSPSSTSDQQQSHPVLIQGDVEKEKERTGGLLQLVVVGLWNEGLSSMEMIQDSGWSSVPSALAQFWLGLARRIANHMAEVVLLKVL